MCVNSASTVLRGAGDNGENNAKPGKARSSRVRQGVNERLDGDALFSLEKPVYSTFACWFSPWGLGPCHVKSLMKLKL